MNAVSPSDGPQAAGPSRRAWWAWVGAVALAHVALAAWWSGPLVVQLFAGEAAGAAADKVAKTAKTAKTVQTVTRVSVSHAPRAPAAPVAPRAVATVHTAGAGAAPAAANVPSAGDQPPHTPLAQASEAAAGAAAPPSPSHPHAQQAVAQTVNATPPAKEDPPQVDAAPGQERADAALWPVGALPPSQALHYDISGQHRGLPYSAQGELSWQQNGADYSLQLALRSFLLGQRLKRSVGHMDAAGLQPRRYADQSRSELAAHFDRAQQQVVFSSNNRPVPLQPGAQDEVSLYVQLAAALAADPLRYTPGTQLQVQTATVRSAERWSLLLERSETLALQGRAVPTLKWVIQPRGRYETRVEFWVSEAHAWLPVRIRMVQANGSHVELLWQRTELLAALPAT